MGRGSTAVSGKGLTKTPAFRHLYTAVSGKGITKTPAFRHLHLYCCQWEGDHQDPGLSPLTSILLSVGRGSPRPRSFATYIYTAVSGKGITKTPVFRHLHLYCCQWEGDHQDPGLSPLTSILLSVGRGSPRARPFATYVYCCQFASFATDQSRDGWISRDRCRLEEPSGAVISQEGGGRGHTLLVDAESVSLYQHLNSTTPANGRSWSVRILRCFAKIRSFASTTKVTVATDEPAAPAALAAATALLCAGLGCRWWKYVDGCHHVVKQEQEERQGPQPRGDPSDYGSDPVRGQRGHGRGGLSEARVSPRGEGETLEMATTVSTTVLVSKGLYYVCMQNAQFYSL